MGDVAIHWFTSDLRLADNAALAAGADARAVVAAYVLDPIVLRRHAQPFHRMFSPVRQGQRFDPEGDYVRRWVPELARVPVRHVHEPWSLAPLERRALCPDYPPPIVDLDAARGRALAAFEQARRRSESG